MRIWQSFSIVVVMGLLLAGPLSAQDAGVPDSLWYVPAATTWTIDTPGDTLFTVELWAWTDQSNISGASLGFELTTSTGGGTGPSDSLIVADSFYYGAINAFVKTFAKSSLDPDYPAEHKGLNGYLLGIVNIGAGFLSPSVPTKIGDFQLKVLDPTRLPCNFDIVVDSSFYPPAGTFKFSPSVGMGFPPVFNGCTITVSNALCPSSPAIGLSPTDFEFTATEGDTNPDPQILFVSNTGEGTLNWSASDDAGWLTLSPTSGVDDGPCTLFVDISGLTAADYTATVTVSDPAADNSPQDVPVTLHLLEPPPVMSVSPDSLLFNAVYGDPNPSPQAIVIDNTGGGALSWTAGDNADWITLSPTTGTDGEACTVYVDISGLLPNTYGAMIDIQDPGAVNSPQFVPVLLVVEPPPPVIALDPDSFTFDAVEGGANPDPQVLAISNAVIGDLNWSASDDAAWLSLSPTSGVGDGPCTLYVDISALSEGTYDAEVSVTDPAATNSPQTASVTLNVAAAPPEIDLNPQNFSFSVTLGDPNPLGQVLTIANTGGGTLNWTASESEDWLSLNPTSGTGAGTCTLSVDYTYGLGPGVYQTMVTVADPAASNSPQMAEVTFTVADTAQELRAIFDPDPAYIYYKFAIDSIMATVYLGDFPDSLAPGDVDPNSVLVNGWIPARSVSVTTHPDFVGDVLAAVIPIGPFLDDYGALLDTTLQQFTVTAYLTDKCDIEVVSTVTIIGKYSSNPKMYILPENDFTIYPGDIDQSGEIDIDDVNILVEYVFRGNPLPGSILRGDLNCSHYVDIDDVMRLVEYIFAGGVAPCAP